MSVKKLARFGNAFSKGRSEPPSSAEKHRLDNFTRICEMPSRLLPGKIVYTYHPYCPWCEEDIEIEHGDRILCDCGLIMECYGNALTVWRDSEGRDSEGRNCDVGSA